jgi:hypothetical protein
MNNEIIKCLSCGAAGVNNIEECQVRFEKILEHEFTNPAFFKAHCLTIDAYSLQHPEILIKVF